LICLVELARIELATS